MADYKVVWSPSMQAEAERAQQRPAPPIEEHKKGNRPVFPAGFEGTKEDQRVIDMRDRWTRTKIHTQAMPRGVIIKT